MSKRMTIEVYLDSGHTLRFKCSDFKVEFDRAERKYVKYSAQDVDRDFGFMPTRMVGWCRVK